MMAVTDGTLEPPSPKKRRTQSWRTIAKAAEQECNTLVCVNTALDARLDVAQAQLVRTAGAAEMWKTTNAFNDRLFRSACGVVGAEAVVIFWLAFWHYKP